MESNLTSVDAIEEGGSNEKKSCAICGTSITPLWRNGPASPKSLCNACGIRNRKKTRAEKNLSDSFKQRLMELGREVIQIPIEGIQVGIEAVQRQEPSSSNKLIRKSKSWITRFLVFINLLLEIVSAVADQLSSIRKPHFARISLLMSILSLVLSIIDLSYKIKAHKARFQCKWHIPWFYYPSRGYNRIFGSFTDTVLLFCAVGQLIVSTINYNFIERRRDGPIKVSVWPLFFAIGMVTSKFMEKPTISMENWCNNNVSIQTNE